MYIFDEYVGRVEEIDYSNKMERKRFDNKYNFHCDRLEDIPVVNGVREFMNGYYLVFTSDDPIALATAVEEAIISA